jgi:hypothetical protein
MPEKDGLTFREIDKLDLEKFKNLGNKSFPKRTTSAATPLEDAIARCNNYIKTGRTKEEKSLRKKMCQPLIDAAKAEEKELKKELKRQEKEIARQLKEDLKDAKERDRIRKNLAQLAPYAYGD